MFFFFFFGAHALERSGFKTVKLGRVGLPIETKSLKKLKASVTHYCTVCYRFFFLWSLPSLQYVLCTFVITVYGRACILLEVSFLVCDAHTDRRTRTRSTPKKKGRGELLVSVEVVATESPNDATHGGCGDPEEQSGLFSLPSSSFSPIPTSGGCWCGAFFFFLFYFRS